MKPLPSLPSRQRFVAGTFRRVARGSALALVLAFGGCMVGPDYKPPVTKSPSDWSSLGLSQNDTYTGNQTGNATTVPVANDTLAPLDNSTAAPASNATAAPTGNTTTAPASNTTAAPAGNITGGNATAGPNLGMPGNTTLTTRNSLVSADPETIVSWWTKFHDDQLNALIAEAAARNLTVLGTEALIQQARATINVVSGSLWPSVNGDGGYNYGGTGGGNNFSTYKVGATANWNLDVWGGTRRQIESAEASLQAAVENRNDALVVLTAQVGTTYLDLRTAQYLLQINHTNLDIQEHTVSITEQRFNDGFVSKLDVENARAQAANTRAQIPSLETEALQDIYLLGVLLGKDPNALLTQLTPTGPMLVAQKHILVGLPSDLLRRRPDIRSAEAQMHAANANIGVAISALFPQFSIASSLNFQAANAGQLLKWSNSSWTVGPAVNWQIFAAGSIIANVRLSEAAELGAFYNYKSTVLTAFQQVEDSMTAFIKEQQRRDALRDSVEANQIATDLSMRLYREGSTEFLNVLTAESGLFSSQQQLALSERAVAADLISLYQALGGGWSEFPEQNSVNEPFPKFPYAPPPPIPRGPHGGVH